MVKIEAIIRPSRLHEVKAALAGLGMGRMTVTDVRGVGHQRGRSLKGDVATRSWHHPARG